MRQFRVRRAGLFLCLSGVVLSGCARVDTEALVATEVARRLDQFATETALAPTATSIPTATSTWTPEPTDTPIDTLVPTPDMTETWDARQRTLDVAGTRAATVVAAHRRTAAVEARATSEAQEACSTLWDLWDELQETVDTWNYYMSVRSSREYDSDDPMRRLELLSQWSHEDARQYQHLSGMVGELAHDVRMLDLPASAEYLRYGFLAVCELDAQTLDLYGAGQYAQGNATLRQANATKDELYKALQDYCGN